MLCRRGRAAIGGTSGNPEAILGAFHLIVDQVNASGESLDLNLSRGSSKKWQ
jgi:hypothetical protein